MPPAALHAAPAALTGHLDAENLGQLLSRLAHDVGVETAVDQQLGADLPRESVGQSGLTRLPGGRQRAAAAWCRAGARSCCVQPHTHLVLLLLVLQEVGAAPHKLGLDLGRGKGEKQ